MRLVMISDTHGFHEQLEIPDGDVLVHAGDFCLHGEAAELEAFDRFLGALPHSSKLVVAGNHDFCMQAAGVKAAALLSNADYLIDSGCVIDGMNFWGSPWQPIFLDMAFNLPAAALRQRWAEIPEDTDVLITHTPPRDILDLTSLGISAGCDELARRLESVQPKLHVFGHIHEGYGIQATPSTTFVNACSCTLDYQPSQPPLVIDI